MAVDIFQLMKYCCVKLRLYKSWIQIYTAEALKIITLLVQIVHKMLLQVLYLKSCSTGLQFKKTKYSNRLLIRGQNDDNFTAQGHFELLIFQVWNVRNYPPPTLKRAKQSLHQHRPVTLQEIRTNYALLNCYNISTIFSLFISKSFF